MKKEKDESSKITKIHLNIIKINDIKATLLIIITLIYYIKLKDEWSEIT